MATTYIRKHGDVLQRRSTMLKDRPWLPYAAVIPSNERQAVDAVATGTYDGVQGEWRIVRDQGKQALP